MGTMARDQQKRFAPKLKIKKGDKVQLIAGDDKGKEGEVKAVYPKKNRVIVDGANMVTKHTKPDAKNPDGGIIKTEASIHISNVMLLDPKDAKPTRVGRKSEGDTIVRFAKKSGEKI